MRRWILALLFVFPLASQAVSFTQYPTSTNTSGSFTLAWQSLPTDTQNFKVQELKAGVETRVVANSGTSVIVTGLSSGTYSYELWITRRYYNNQISEWVRETTKHDTISVVVSVTIPPPAKPTAPSLSNNGSYSVSWDAVTGANSYRLEEQINTGGWLEVQNSADRSIAYTGKADGTYGYRVRACIGSNCSGYSATATVQVSYPPAVAPGISSNVSQTTYSYQGNLSVAWNTVATATRYELEQLIGSTWTNKVRANQTSVSLLNYELGSYSFRVRACNAGGCSGWSATRVISLAQAPNITGATTSRGTVSLTWAQPGPANYVNVVENNVLIATFSPVSDGKTLTLNRPDGTYNYTMRSCIQIDGGTDNCQPYGLAHTVQVLTAPGIPASITVPPTSDNGSLAVSWGVATGTVHRYQLFQQLGSGSWQPVYSGTARAATATGLADGSYRFQVRACNTLAGSEACSNYRTSTTALAAAKPGVPPGISGVPATSNTGSFTVSWTAASGNVDRYELEQQQNGGAWTQVYSGTALSQLRSMADGSYGYRVRACNVEGSFASCSSYRTSGTVVVAVTPGVPGNISGVPATSGSGSFTVSWTAASGNVDRYELEQQHNGGSWTQVYSGTALSQQRSVADGSYGYRVRACNVEGSFTSCSSYRTSGTVVVELIPAVPAKPTAPAISNNGSYTVSWLSSTHASGYVLEERINSGNWVVAQNNASLSKSYTANAVAIYTYRVSACNGSSCSAPSEIATTQVVYPPAVAPGISSNVSQTTYSYQGNLSVAWNTVATATRYELEQLIGSTWTNKVRANQTSVSLLNYELGSYSFRVRACNAGGCSGWSATRVISLAQAPNITGATTSRGTVSLTWAQPGPANYVNVVENNVLIATFSPVSDGKTLTLNRPDGTYNYTMRSCIQIDGGTDNCQPYGLAHTVQVLTAPGIPASITVPPTSDNGSLAVSWGVATGTVHRYQLFQQLGSGSWQPVYSGTARAATATGLADGSYRFQVRACNTLAGSEACSNYRTSTTALAAAKPAVPAGITVPVNSSSASLSISWLAEPSGHADEYRLQQQFNGGSWQTIFSGNVLNTNVAVNADGRYAFRVMACNTEQSFTSCSGETASASALVAIAPGMPGVFSGVPSTSTSGAFNMSWGQASGRVDRYELEQVAAGGGLTPLYDGPLLSHAVALGADGSYTFRVRACNDEAGFSGCSAYRTSSATVVAAIPATPGAPSHNATGLGKLAINWGVLAKPAYYVSLQGRVNSGSWTAIGGNHSGTGIPPVNLADGQWQFRIRLCNEYNWACSSYSPASSAAAVRSEPLAPTGLQLPDSSDGALLLNWLAADNKATYFQVFKRQGGGDWQPAAADVATESAAISNLAAGNWELAVKACNDFAWACSPYSSPVTHTVIAVPDWVRKSFEQPVLGTVSNDTYTPLKPDTGAIRAEAGVSGGQASYRLAMPLPPGRAAMQPEVSINYHSQQGNGVMGVGFGLAAGEAISRCAATVAQDGFTANVSYTATDRLCLNGQRLMAVSGSYGAVNSQYRTEIDQFSRVTQLGGSLNQNSVYFKVDYPNGRTAYFGSAASTAKVIHSGRSEAFSWLVDYILDATGKNAIHYNYDDLGSGEVLLNSIYYTGNSASVQGDRSVRFTYENRPDISQSYLAAGLSMQTQRLKTISSYVGGDMTQQFSLTYKASGASSRSLLQAIEQCGYQQAQSVCYEPTEFSWQDTPVTYQLEPLTFDGNRVYQEVREIAGVVPHGDINGDGVRDWPGYFVSAEGTVNGQHQFELQSCKRNPLTLRTECLEADFNNDGLSDGWRLSNINRLVLLYTTASLGQQAVATDIVLRTQYNMSTDKDRVEHLADFNGNGWTDMVIYRYNNAQPVLELYWHSGNPNAPYQESRKALLYTYEVPQGGLKAVSSVQFIGDIDGNGLPDMVESSVDYLDAGQTAPVHVVRNLRLNRSNGQHAQFDTQEFVMPSGAGNPRYFSYFMDINGDGLPDWVGWTDENFSVNVRLNQGAGQFGPLQDVNIQVPRRFYRTYLNNGEWVQVSFPRYLNSFRVMDINQDGRAQLLMPGARVTTACATINNYLHQLEDVCGEQMYNAVRQSSASFSTYPLDVTGIDDSVYQYKAVSFTVTTQGNITASIEDTPLYGSAIENTVIDAFGKGLNDLVFAYGPRSAYTRIDSVSGAMAPFGHQYGLYINRNRGSATGAAPYAQPDVLKAVQDGFNVVHQWDYLPLSSAKSTLRNSALSLDSADISAQNTSLAFYLPDRSYVEDGQHFHFASSMFAVAQFSSSDGLGGMSHTRYAYRGAMYHTQGRGFRGFRAIVTEDSHTGLISHTDFRQKFPFTGQVRGQFSFASPDYPSAYPTFGYDAAQATQAANALSVQVYNWQQNPAHANAMGTSCTSQYRPETDETDLSCPAGAVVSLYLAGTDNYTYDLHSKQQYSHQRSRTSSIDAFGNVLQSSQTITDDSGIYASQTEATYEPQANPWWPHRLQSQTRHSMPVQQQGTVLGYDPALDSTSWVKTSYSNWHLSGAPQQVALSSSDDSRSQSVLTSFNDYGLPLSVTRTADIMNAGGVWHSQSRTEHIRYSKNGTTEAAEGYFPFKLTNALNHISYLHTDAATGQPASQIDANGVTTTMTYDAFGRAASMQRTGQAAQYSWYDSATHDNNAPAGAVWMQIVTQAGMPQQRSYYDQLGRALRKSIKGFAGDWINQDTEYNQRGLVVRQSGPYQAGIAGGETRFADYDILGRPGSKLLPGGLGIEYHYNGLNTDITANSSLQMRRSYNSLNKLLHTEDANGGHTYYRYNGQGLPIVLQDANGVQLTAGYNSLGQKLQVNDPNQGSSNYQYNGFGELEQETDANGLAIRFDYDVLGRQTARTSYSGSTVKDSAAFSYDTAFKGLPYQESANGITRTFGYDGSGQLVSNMLALDGKGFTTRYFYDNSTGQPTGQRYPNGLTVQYGYTPSGYLQQVSNLASGYVYRTITSQDAFGNTLSASLGNGTAQDNRYDNETGWVQSLTAWHGGSRIHDVEYQQYDVYGNIRQVHNHVTGATESYDYDELHRLTQSTYSNQGYTVPISYSYDAVGNLQSKSDYANTYRYGNAQKSLGGNAGANAVRQVVKLNNSTINFSYDNQGNLTAGDGLSISYNSFKQPTQISRSGNSFAFTYGANLERLKEVRNGVTTYEIDKLYEEESSGAWRIYLSDIAIIKYDATNQHQIRYTHKDRLGSTLTYTDHNGQVTDRRMFDAFGKPRATDGNTLTPPRLQNLTLSRNGFTDHRHLDEVELIHMNGRAYDYNLGRFLSVDPLIQDAANSQSLNPYSYIINNPLSGTDPTGYARVTGSRIDRDIKKSDIIGDNITGAGGNVTFSGTFQGGGNGGSSNNGLAAPATESPTDIQSSPSKSWNPSKTTEIAEKYENISTDVDVEIAAMESDSNDLGQTASRGGRRGNATRDPLQPYINAKYNRVFEQIRELDPHFSVARPAGRNATRREVEFLEQHLSGIRGAPPLDLTPLGGGRNAAFRQAKRDNGIPTSAQPVRVTPNYDRNGKIQPGEVYWFRVYKGNMQFGETFIRRDAGGHYYGPNSIHNRGPHYNDQRERHYDY